MNDFFILKLNMFSLALSNLFAAQTILSVSGWLKLNISFVLFSNVFVNVKVVLSPSAVTWLTLPCESWTFVEQGGVVSPNLIEKFRRKMDFWPASLMQNLSFSNLF